MKIYTYYEEICFPEQQEMLSIWKNNWETKGFQPIVLERKDAKSHFLFNEYVNTLNKRHKNLLGRDISEYGLSCYFRWLAYANLNIKETFLVSDYDVINVRLKKQDVSGFHLMSNLCPCLASGNSKDFLMLSRFFLEYSRKIKKISNFHDQDILAHAGEKEILRYLNNLKISMLVAFPENVHPFCKEPYFPTYHVSHRAASRILLEQDSLAFLLSLGGGGIQKQDISKNRIVAMKTLSNI